MKQHYKSKQPVPVERVKSYKEGIHYYMEGEQVIFTALAHKIRGQCCGNGCRHCPYDQRYQKPMLRNIVVKAEHNELARYVNKKYGTNLVIKE